MKNSAIGSNWKDVRSELFSKEEILESDMRVAIMSELIEFDAAILTFLAS